jgi:hypothetical protein
LIAFRIHARCPYSAEKDRATLFPRRPQLQHLLDRPDIGAYEVGMKPFWLLVAICAGCSAAEAPSSPPPADLLRAEIQELQAVVRTLRAENLQLTERNRLLLEELARRGRPPLPPATSAAEAPTPPRPAVAAVEGPQLLYVNPAWHYAIVNLGSDSGLEKGRQGRIVRDGEEIGTLRVTDTKPGQSVAELHVEQLGRSGIYPRQGDQVVFP